MRDRTCRTRASDKADINFNFELPAAPDTQRKLLTAMSLFTFGLGIGTAGLVHQYAISKLRAGWICASMSGATALIGLTLLWRVSRELARWRSAFALAWTNAKLRLKRDLDEELPDDPIQVARILQEVEETAMRKVEEAR